MVFGWFWGCGAPDKQLTRRKLGKKTHPNHGGRRRPTAAMVPPSRRRRTQQSANMLRDKSMSLKLDNIIVFTIYLAIKGMARRRRHRRKVPVFGCCNGRRWPTWAGGQCRRLRGRTGAGSDGMSLSLLAETRLVFFSSMTFLTSTKN